MWNSILNVLDNPVSCVIIGVLLGAILGEGIRYIHGFLEIRRLKKCLEDELSAIKAHLPQKKDILEQGIDALENNRVLPMSSVHAPSSIYDSHLALLSGHLRSRQRNCLHVIYEKLRVLDKTMDSFRADFQQDIADECLKNPFKAYKGILIDLLRQCDVVVRNIESYLNGNPIDVHQTKKEQA